MNRSYSKIRHIQEANQRLEKRMINEQPVVKGSVATDYPKCIQGSLANKNLAEIFKTKSGQYYVSIKNMPAFQGYLFYSNGRVGKPDRTMGNYTCGPSNYPLIDGVDVVANNWQKQKGTATNYEKGEQQKISNQSAAMDAAAKFYQKNNHTINLVLGIGTSVIPVIGPFISSGIGMMDAKQYWDEGHRAHAGVAAAFSLLPGVGAVVSKIPGIKQLGAKGMSALAGKLVSKGPLTQLEQNVVAEIGQNSTLITQAVDDTVKQLASQGVNKTGDAAIKSQLKQIAHKGVHSSIEKGVEHTTADLLSGGADKYIRGAAKLGKITTTTFPRSFGGVSR